MEQKTKVDNNYSYYEICLNCKPKHIDDGDHVIWIKLKKELNVINNAPGAISLRQIDEIRYDHGVDLLIE